MMSEEHGRYDSGHIRFHRSILSVNERTRARHRLDTEAAEPHGKDSGKDFESYKSHKSSEEQRTSLKRVENHCKSAENCTTADNHEHNPQSTESRRLYFA